MARFRFANDGGDIAIPPDQYEVQAMDELLDTENLGVVLIPLNRPREDPNGFILPAGTFEEVLAEMNAALAGLEPMNRD